MKYGIRMLTVNWACENGGDDCTGTRAEMLALLHSWRDEQGILPNVKYDVIPYTGENEKPPTFPVQWENSRNSRMKE